MKTAKFIPFFGVLLLYGATIVPVAARAQGDDASAGEVKETAWISDVSADGVEPVSFKDVPRYVLEKIRIEGNRKTMPHVILRYLELSPGEVFAVNDERLESARYRMLATGLFSNVRLTLEKGSARGYSVLVIRVKERNTIVVKDLTFGLTRIAPYWDSVTPYGSIGVADNSFLGTGISISASIAAGKDQLAYTLGFRDDHIMNSRVGLHVEGLFADGNEYFGEHYLPAPEEEADFPPYSQLDYRRTGIRLGVGYNLLRNYFFWFDFRFENILAEEPVVVDSSGTPTDGADHETTTGYLESDASILTGVIFGFTRDTRNHPILTSDGAVTQFSVETSHPIMGSNYEFTKFYLSNSAWFPFGKKVRQSFCIGTVAGLVMGNAPFFDQFYVGDYSAFIPNRTLGLNFSNLHPSVLNTTIDEMWYEDLVAGIDLTWNVALYRGDGFLYGIDGFINAGFFALTSSDKIGDGGFPVDLTADFGVRFDTRVGMFLLSFGSIVQMIPPVYEGTTN